MITGCQRNERRWQEILYKKYFDPMFAMVKCKVPDENSALEVLNNGFLKVFLKISTFRGEGSLEGWIRRLIYNAMVDYFHEHKRYKETFALGEPPHYAGTGEGALDRLYWEDLISCLDRLPPATASVFKYNVLEGMNHKEIGGVLNISEGTSKWHLSEAKKKLREIILESQKSNG
jgi:RNA polymerase sigma factor (sigma-70 family)